MNKHERRRLENGLQTMCTARTWKEHTLVLGSATWKTRGNNDDHTTAGRVIAGMEYRSRASRASHEAVNLNWTMRNAARNRKHCAWQARNSDRNLKKGI